MKNITKKIASIAMAFTLLGAGTAITNTVSPKSDNTFVAKATFIESVGGVRTRCFNWVGSGKNRLMYIYYYQSGLVEIYNANTYAWISSYYVSKDPTWSR